MNRAEQSKEYMKQHGMTKGVLQDNNGSVCMLGAVICSEVEDLMSPEAQEIWDRDKEFIDLLGEIIKEQFPERAQIGLAIVNRFDHVVVSYFNDHDQTTFEDVETIFDKAAVRLDELV